MSLFYPTLVLPEISEVTPKLLEKLGVTALILDVDNTLALNGVADPDTKALEWLARMKAGGYPMVILSNNHLPRVRSFAHKLGLNYIASGKKPLTGGYRKITRDLGKKPEEIAIIGDQIFTDVLGANIFGCKCLLISPLKEEDGFFYKIKRGMEKGILRRYEKLHRKASE